MANPKATKWPKFIEFEWSPYFWLGGLKNSSGRAVLIGCDMFQAELNIVIFTPIFKILMYFPPLYPPRAAPGAPFYLWTTNENMRGS